MIVMTIKSLLGMWLLRMTRLTGPSVQRRVHHRPGDVPASLVVSAVPVRRKDRPIARVSHCRVRGDVNGPYGGGTKVAVTGSGILLQGVERPALACLMWSPR